MVRSKNVFLCQLFALCLILGFLSLSFIFKQDKPLPSSVINSGTSSAMSKHVDATITNTIDNIRPYRGFVMQHMLKAGGNSCEKLLAKLGWNKRLKPKQSIYQKGLGYIWLEDDAAEKWYSNITNRWNNDKMNQTLERKLPPLLSFPRSDFFRIGMVREPCDYMVSVWAFSLQGKHAKLAGRCTGWDAVTNFSNFLSATSSEMTWISFRMAAQFLGDNLQQKSIYDLILSCQDSVRPELLIQYKDFMNHFNVYENADCWVRTENILSDMKFCFQRHVQRRGGSTALNLTRLLERETEPKKNAGSHNSCKEYYSAEEAELVWKRDGSLATQLGYKSCCDGLVLEKS